MVRIAPILVPIPDWLGFAERIAMILAETFIDGGVKAQLLQDWRLELMMWRKSKNQRDVKGNFSSEELAIKFLPTGSFEELQIQQSIGFRA